MRLSCIAYTSRVALYLTTCEWDIKWSVGSPRAYAGPQVRSLRSIELRLESIDGRDRFQSIELRLESIGGRDRFHSVEVALLMPLF